MKFYKRNDERHNIENVQFRIGLESAEGRGTDAQFEFNARCGKTPANQDLTLGNPFGMNCPFSGKKSRYVVGQKTVPDSFSFDEIYIEVYRGEAVTVVRPWAVMR